MACGDGNLLNIQTFKVAAIPEVTVKEVIKDVFVLENAQIRVKVADGVITSLYDRITERERRGKVWGGWWEFGS